MWLRTSGEPRTARPSGYCRAKTTPTVAVTVETPGLVGGGGGAELVLGALSDRTGCRLWGDAAALPAPASTLPDSNGTISELPPSLIVSARRASRRPGRRGSSPSPWPSGRRRRVPWRRRLRCRRRSRWAANAGGAGGDRLLDEVAAFAGSCRVTPIPSLAWKRPPPSLSTETRPVLTSPAPTPGIAWTAAITLFRLAETARRAAPRLPRGEADAEPEGGAVVRHLDGRRRFHRDGPFDRQRAGGKQRQRDKSEEYRSPDHHFSFFPLRRSFKRRHTEGAFGCVRAHSSSVGSRPALRARSTHAVCAWRAALVPLRRDQEVLGKGRQVPPAQRAPIGGPASDSAPAGSSHHLASPAHPRDATPTSPPSSSLCPRHEQKEQRNGSVAVAAAAVLAAHRDHRGAGGAGLDQAAEAVLGRRSARAPRG